MSPRSSDRGGGGIAGQTAAVRVALAAALDDWAAVRRSPRRDPARARSPHSRSPAWPIPTHGATGCAPLPARPLLRQEELEILKQLARPSPEMDCRR